MRIVIYKKRVAPDQLLNTRQNPQARIYSHHNIKRDGSII